MLYGYKKKRYQLFDNLDYLGFNLYEQRHFCFGDEGDGPGSEGGFAEDYADSINSAVAAAEAEAEQEAAVDEASPTSQAAQDEEDLGQDFSGYGGPDFDGGRAGGPEGSSVGSGARGDPDSPNAPGLERRWVPEANLFAEVPRAEREKLSTIQMMMDPAIHSKALPGVSPNAQTFLEMMVEIALTFPPEDPTHKYAMRELDRGRLADEVQDPDLMNKLEKAGLRSFNTGYRGKYEARSGPTNMATTRENYDPNTLTGADPSSQSSVNLSMFNQFAIDNPNMSVAQAMEAYNNEMGPNSVNQVSAAELGMLGYAANAPAGRAAQDNENERERGVQQGLGLLAGFAVSPTSLFSSIMSPELSDPSTLGNIIDEVVGLSGIVGPSLTTLDEAFGMTTALGLQDLYDSLPDMPSITGFGGLLGDPEDETETAAFTGFETPESFFANMTTAERDVAIADIMNPEEIDDQPLRTRTPFQTTSTPEPEPESNFTSLPQPRDTSPPTSSGISDSHYQRLVEIYGPERADKLFNQLEEA